jgi:hypothetical protein
MMENFNRENASSTAVGVCYRNGEPATSVGKRITGCGEQDPPLAFTSPSPIDRSATSHAGYDCKATRT